MFERFTDKARTVVIRAKAKATERGDQIRPVYMLHALASGDGVAARALAGPGALERVPLTPQGPLNWTGRMTLTREAKQSLALAVQEARALHHSYPGTEHLLLGLLSAAERNPRGDFTVDTLRDLGIDLVQARQRVLDELRHASA